MKKSLGLLLFGFFATAAAGIGCLRSAIARSDVQRVEAGSKTSYVGITEEETFELGSYPQDVVTTLSADEIKTNGAEKQTPYGGKYYLYQSKRYAILDVAVVDAEGSDGRKLSNGDEVNGYNGSTNVVFEFKPIEWQLLRTAEEDTAYLISTRILDREIYHQNLPQHVSYPDSSLYDYLNENFKIMAFNNDDCAYFPYADKGLDGVPITIPSRNEVELDSYPDKHLKQASDFAILKNLTSHSAWNHGTGVPYLNAGYWLQTFSTDADRMAVCWAKVAVSHCLMDDPKIGVRPVIQVNYKIGGGGGTSSETEKTPETKTPSTGGGNVPLGLGIAFTILGAGGLIAVFVVWAKKHASGKPPVWIIISIAGCMVLSVVGLGCFAGGLNGGGGSNCFQCGYYVQTDLYSGGGITQVAYGGWLIKSDGTASYSSRIRDNKNASDFSPDNYMTGTYTIKGSQLIIEIPKHEIKNFGTVGGTYTYTIQGCDFFRNSEGSYRWVRGE